MTDKEMIRAKKTFAALITRAKPGELEETMWYNACGLGPAEEAWDELQGAFEEIFGVTWKEAEKLAKEIF